ncbi:unnamed protein product [Lupinus luteus]|uniref:Cystatin domain-containing protein n=1 Tax=Lupinus luteus TaxID=3873 RepID=A0AAV1WFX8_LUPLU
MAASQSILIPVDPKDPHLHEITTFAVSVHNKESGKNLKLESIIKGDDDFFGDLSQFKILLTASDGPDNLDAL